MKIINKYNKIVLTSLFTVILSVLVFNSFNLVPRALADTKDATGIPANYTLLEPLPCIQGQGYTCDATKPITSINFKDYVQYAFNLMIALAALAAVFYIVWGGFEYMTTDSWQGKSDGLKKVKNAIFGLVLVLSSFLILKTVDPRLVEIPDTLVPQLTLNYDKNATGRFFDDLESDANKYLKESDQLRAQRNEARVKVNDLSNQWYDLQDQINEAMDDGDTEKIEQLKLEASNIDDQISKLQSNVVASTREDNLKGRAAQVSTYGDNILQNWTDHFDPKYLDQVSLSLEDEHRRGVEQLKQISNPPDPGSLQIIEDSYNYSKGVVAIQKALEISQLQSFSTGAKPNLPKDRADITAIASTISDPTLRSDLLTSMNTKLKP